MVLMGMGFFAAEAIANGRNGDTLQWGQSLHVA